MVTTRRIEQRYSSDFPAKVKKYFIHTRFRVISETHSVITHAPLFSSPRRRKKVRRRRRHGASCPQIFLQTAAAIVFSRVKRGRSFVRTRASLMAGCMHSTALLVPVKRKRCVILCFFVTTRKLLPNDHGKQ